MTASPTCPDRQKRANAQEGVTLLRMDQRIFDPATVRQSTSGKPSPRMDRQ